MVAIGAGFSVQFLSRVVIKILTSVGEIDRPQTYQVVFGLRAAFVLTGLILIFSNENRYLSDDELCAE
jgi:hypothetical protein